MKYYSASTGGFYDTQIHGVNIPSDAIEISESDHFSLMEGQSRGKRIVADGNGLPVLSDPLGPTFSQSLAILNAQFQADILVLNNAYAMAVLVDGPSEVTKQTAIRAQYAARKDAHTAAIAALKIEFGV